MLDGGDEVRVMPQRLGTVISRLLLVATFGLGFAPCDVVVIGTTGDPSSCPVDGPACPHFSRMSGSLRRDSVDRWREEFGVATYSSVSRSRPLRR
jgi:hypothetical protein